MAGNNLQHLDQKSIEYAATLDENEFRMWQANPYSVNM